MISKVIIATQDDNEMKFFDFHENLIVFKIFS